VLHFAATVLGAIRKKKSEEQRPLKTPVAKAVIRAPAPQLELLALVEKDLRASGLIRDLETIVGDTFEVTVTLAPPEVMQEKAQ
jgi:valyl-tRNA synthetase